MPACRHRHQTSVNAAYAPAAGRCCAEEASSFCWQNQPVSFNKCECCLCSCCRAVLRRRSITLLLAKPASLIWRAAPMITHQRLPVDRTVTLCPPKASYMPERPARRGYHMMLARSLCRWEPSLCERGCGMLGVCECVWVCVSVSVYVCVCAWAWDVCCAVSWMERACKLCVSVYVCVCMCVLYARPICEAPLVRERMCGIFHMNWRKVRALWPPLSCSACCGTFIGLARTIYTVNIQYFWQREITKQFWPTLTLNITHSLPCDLIPCACVCDCMLTFVEPKGAPSHTVYSYTWDIHSHTLETHTYIPHTHAHIHTYTHRKMSRNLESGVTPLDGAPPTIRHMIQGSDITIRHMNRGRNITIRHMTPTIRHMSQGSNTADTPPAVHMWFFRHLHQTSPSPDGSGMHAQPRSKPCPWKLCVVSK